GGTGRELVHGQAPAVVRRTWPMAAQPTTAPMTMATRRARSAMSRQAAKWCRSRLRRRSSTGVRLPRFVLARHGPGGRAAVRDVAIAAHDVGLAGEAGVFVAQLRIERIDVADAAADVDQHAG